MTDDKPPDETKLTQTKRLWANLGKFLTGRTTRPEDDRLPPGQHLVRNWPVLDLGLQPDIAKSSWRLDVVGAVDRPLHLDWPGLQALPQSTVVSDIHCVTTWSRYDNAWAGVLTRDLLSVVMPKPEAKFVLLGSYDGYTTNVPLEDFAAPDAALVHGWEGRPLTTEHGGPLRLVVPHLYFWKSAKWLNRIEFLTTEKPGYWERNGYHIYGNPWREQRYSED
jgi:DMSO/TMAO reductase YedYZ molybdopterin-dependent catalytic subunit